MKRKRGFEASVSLFPFLDVLICTMGALILALVVTVLDAASAARRAAAAPSAGASQEQQADFALRIEQLDGQRKANLQDLETERAALSHIEGHLRLLHAQLDGARAEAENLAKASSNSLSDRKLLERRLAELAEEIRRLEALLAAQKRDAASAPPAYAIVPYVGPNGTRRRPIYIECRGDRVVIQPEGVELRAEDFEGPLGPGNPLAAAVRAASESRGDGDPGSPYPFLLVRPDGVEAYAAARAALRSWGSDFGYELIDQQWDIALPPRNAAMAERIETELAGARERQKLLAESVPRLRGGEGGAPSFRADPVRGIVQVGGGPDRRRGSPANSGGFHAGGSGEEGPPNSALGDGRAGSGAGFGAGNGRAGGPPGATGVDGEFAGSAAQAHPPTAASGGSPSDFAQEGPLLTSGNGAAAMNAVDPHGRGTLSGRSPTDVGAELAREREAESNGNSGFGAPGAGRSLSQQGSGATPNGPRPPSDPGATAGQGMPGGQPGASQPGSGEAPKLGEYVERPPRGAEVSHSSGDHPSKSVKSLSEKRGRDWALPEQARSATPITRPIRIELTDSTLRVIDDDGASARKSIALNKSTIDAVDDLVSAIWDSIRDWGIAGRGQYWRPVLLIDVAPGAERRYAELQGLLADSGLEVRPRLAEKPNTPATR